MISSKVNYNCYINSVVIKDLRLARDSIERKSNFKLDSMYIRFHFISIYKKVEGIHSSMHYRLTLTFGALPFTILPALPLDCLDACVCAYKNLMR